MAKKTVKGEIKKAQVAASARRAASIEVYDVPIPRNAYEREAVQIDFSDTESLTEQHHARSCDINTILARYKQTGVIEHISNFEPQYGDVSGVEFKDAMDKVAAVKSEFEALPAWARNNFDGVGHYLELMQTDQGVEELRKMVAPPLAYTDEGSPDPEALRPSAAVSDAQEKAAQVESSGEATS